MPIKYPYSIKKTEVHQNLHLAWCDEGTGKNTLLFIHGLAGYLPLWKNQINEFKTKHRCVAMDLPGNGLSPGGEFPYSVFFYSETIAKFIEKENLKHVILCGHSMGGHISIVLALRYPHLIEKLILIAPSGLEAFASHETMGMEHFMDIGQLFYSNASHIDTSVKQSFYKENAASKGIIDDLKMLIKNQSLNKWNQMTTALMKSMLKEQVVPFLETLGIETLIIFGEKDEFIPNKLIHPMETTEGIAKKGAAKIKNSSYHLIKQAGHFVHIEKSAEVNTLIKTFIDEEAS
jgi:pimeloyl-ACP methyl ester carboxylesterase